MKMPFGKHKGKELDDVPDDYLAWALDHCDSLTPTLRMVFAQRLGLATDGDEELQRLRKEVGRLQTENAGLRRQLLHTSNGNDLGDAWKQHFRRLAMLAHPDRGGSHELMALLNEINDKANGK